MEHLRKVLGQPKRKFTSWEKVYIGFMYIFFADYGISKKTNLILYIHVNSCLIGYTTKTNFQISIKILSFILAITLCLSQNYKLFATNNMRLYWALLVGILCVQQA